MSWLKKENVLVPVDLSEMSIQAAEIALEFVPDSSHLHIIHVIRPWSAIEPLSMDDIISEEERHRKSTEIISGHFRDPKFKDVNVKVLFGNPGVEIAEYAQKIKADLIVMPSHGRTGFRHLALGSVAERVLQLVHCPVLVLRK